ncbi:MAG: excinuclease ABC subunit UvrC [Candidatus Izemoplasmataceae bacterium]
MSLLELAKTLPVSPGSYQFKDKNGVVIYVGKAKNLRNRVTSYFRGSHDTKTSRLVMNITDIEYIVTNTELDALLLELNLIKKYNPRYNIMLTDDKTYPYIEITNERHPKLIVTRNISKKSKHLFGPYPNVKAARETVKLLNKLYPLRKCPTLPKEACLYYYMGQCLAPCINKVTKEEYEEIISSIKRFLKGDIKDVVESLKDKMYVASEALEFERALEYKHTIEDIETTTNNQKINLNDMKDRDVVGYTFNDLVCSIEIFFIRHGKISARHQHVFEYYGNPLHSIEDYLAQFYQKEVVPRELFVPNELEVETLADFLDTKIFSPRRGDKKKLLDLAILNSAEGLEEKTNTLKRELDRTVHSVEKLGELLNMPAPYRIEAFDNSNLFLEASVSAMVVFINGKPAKKEYRKYKIKDPDSTSDFTMMKEVLYRRYQRVLLEDLTLPDLLLVDGGKPQITAAKEILSSLDLMIPIVGLVKDDKHSTNKLMMSNYEEVTMDKTSDVFHLLTRIQDEAHRFAITFHKSVRSKGVFHSILDEVKGIGKVTKDKLLQKYKSVEYIKLANLEDLRALGLNEDTANRLIEKLKNKDEREEEQDDN